MLYIVNVDTKIMTKVMASRIKNVLPDIIHPNQTGYVKDRFIGETIRSIYDVMDFIVKENIPGLMLFIDFQKAFDSVEWEFLFKCLEAFNFGSDFLHWVKVFYKSIQSCILNNGITSRFFTLERGVRQGDPLSPYLFVVVVETLAIAIRQNSNIKDVRANCFCASLLRTQIHMPRHRACALNTKLNNNRADGHCYSFAWI